MSNPLTHPDHPYDPDNTFRTETQRLKSLGYTPKSLWTRMYEAVERMIVGRS